MFVHTYICDYIGLFMYSLCSKEVSKVNSLEVRITNITNTTTIQATNIVSN